jgi:hypothetical protein
MDGPELFIVVADADVEQFLAHTLRRGVERRCLREFTWEIRRDPMRDAGVRQSPLRSVPDLRGDRAKLLVVLDHDGCGRELERPDEVERSLMNQLARAGIPDGGADCVVLAPELEAVLVPVWDSVAEIIAQKRHRQAPTPAQVMRALASPLECPSQAWQAVLAQRPKECLHALLRLLQLRHQSALFGEVACRVSLPSLKQGVHAARLFARLNEWFGVPGGAGHCAEP